MWWEVAAPLSTSRLPSTISCRRISEILPPLNEFSMNDVISISTLQYLRVDWQKQKRREDEWSQENNPSSPEYSDEVLERCLCKYWCSQQTSLFDNLSQVTCHNVQTPEVHMMKKCLRQKNFYKAEVRRLEICNTEWYSTLDYDTVSSLSTNSIDKTIFAWIHFYFIKHSALANTLHHTIIRESLAPDKTHCCRQITASYKSSVSSYLCSHKNRTFW